MTKPVTAIGIMMLAEEGKLALRDPVEQYLPEFHGLRVATTVGPDAGHLGVPNLISIMLIQRSDGGAESMTNVFLNMAEASVGK